MAAPERRQRRMTAREAAERLGVSERTIRRIVAEPRAEYEQRARARAEQAAELRARGLTWSQVAEEMNISPGAARMLASRAKKPPADG